MYADRDGLSGIATALRALPPIAPPAGGMAAARARLATRTRARPVGRILAPGYLAMAASLLVMLAAALLSGGGPRGVEEHRARAAGKPPLGELLAENARLESTLARLPATRSVRVGTAYTVAALEDRLALIDDRLSLASLDTDRPELTEDLWRQRVALMNSLVQVRYANAVVLR